MQGKPGGGEMDVGGGRRTEDGGWRKLWPTRQAGSLTLVGDPMDAMNGSSLEMTK